MAKFISNEIMLDILGEVQREQRALVFAGRSAHLDVSVHPNTFEDDGGTHISFDLTVFDEGDGIDKKYEFNSRDTEEQNRARLALLVADINAIAY